MWEKNNLHRFVPFLSLFGAPCVITGLASASIIIMNHQRWKRHHSSYLRQPQWHSTPAQKRMSWVTTSSTPKQKFAEQCDRLKPDLLAKNRWNCSIFKDQIQLASFHLHTFRCWMVGWSLRSPAVNTNQGYSPCSASEYIWKKLIHSLNWAIGWLIWIPRTQGSRISRIHNSKSEPDSLHCYIIYNALFLNVQATWNDSHGTLKAWFPGQCSTNEMRYTV